MKRERMEEEKIEQGKKRPETESIAVLHQSFFFLGIKTLFVNDINSANGK